MKKEEAPNVLNRNMKLLVKAYRLQCEKKFEESFSVIQKSWKIMEKLADLADSQPQMQQMLNTHREIIPNSLFLKKFENKLGADDDIFKPKPGLSQNVGEDGMFHEGQLNMDHPGQSKAFHKR